MKSISADEAQQSLPALLDRVQTGEHFAITRDGGIVAVLVKPEALAAPRAARAWRHADRIRELLERAAEQPLHPPAISEKRAEQLAQTVRTERSSR